MMKSVYMGNVLAQIGHEEWKINMVDTCQLNYCGAPINKVLKTYKDVMKVGIHESVLFQHKSKPLNCTIWCDNSHIKTLLNFLALTIIEGVIKRRKLVKLQGHGLHQ